MNGCPCISTTRHDTIIWYISVQLIARQHTGDTNEKCCMVSIYSRSPALMMMIIIIIKINKNWRTVRHHVPISFFSFQFSHTHRHKRTQAQSTYANCRSAHLIPTQFTRHRTVFAYVIVVVVGRNRKKKT